VGYQELLTGEGPELNCFRWLAEQENAASMEALSAIVKQNAKQANLLAAGSSDIALKGSIKLELSHAASIMQHDFGLVFR
jgi:hypothetical protein